MTSVFRTSLPVVVMLGALALGGCAEFREAAGLDKEAPDEFQVRVRAPLSMPRDYGLRAPRPGATGPQAGIQRDRARQIVLDADGSRRGPRVRRKIKGLSKSETTLIRKLGGDSVDPVIRQTVERESNALVAANKSLVDNILFWKKPPPPGKVVDPGKEARRLQGNAALGRAAKSGDIPTIERKKKGLFSQDFIQKWF